MNSGEIEHYETALRRVRAALHADGAAVIRPRNVAGHDILASDRRGAFDIGATISNSLVNALRRTAKTQTAAGQSVVLAPIVLDDWVVAGLHVVREGLDGFSADEVAAIEFMATELARLSEGTRGLQPHTVGDLLGVSEGSIEWGAGSEAELATGKVLLAFGPHQGADAEVRAMLSTRLKRVLVATHGHVAAVVLNTDPVRVLGLAATAEAPDLPADLLISTTVVQAVIETGLPVLTLDANHDDLASKATSITSLNVASIVCIPLTSARHTAPPGVLYAATFETAAKLGPEALEAVVEDARPLGPLLESLVDR